MTDDPKLTPATPEDLRSLLTYALCFNLNGKPHRQAGDAMAAIAADTLARHLERAGFVVMKKPPAKASSTSTQTE